ncbi:MAG: hypothetical protein ACRD3D_07530 [Terriglobia bacterium]
MSVSPAAVPAPRLSHGTGLEYKAFARRFLQGPDGVLYLVATCYYPTSDFTIFFQENAGTFQLMEQPPSGIFRHLVTYYVASWPSAGVSAERQLPEEVTIVDAQGEHRVPVRPWS